MWKMITKVSNSNQIDMIMAIWLDTNIQAHHFIERARWEDMFYDVKNALPFSDIFIYQDKDEIRGFIGITDNGYIAGLFVSSKFQSQGIGRKLLGHCQQLYQRLELDVFVENERAVNFYKKNGFEIDVKKLNPHFSHEEYHMIWSAFAPEG
jgi:putative acetyltransferase